MRTKARMISMFTMIARRLFRTDESIATPCSVNADGGYRRPPQLEVTKGDLKSVTSCFDNWDMKSARNRSALRLTA